MASFQYGCCCYCVASSVACSLCGPCLVSALSLRLLPTRSSALSSLEVHATHRRRLSGLVHWSLEGTTSGQAPLRPAAADALVSLLVAATQLSQLIHSLGRTGSRCHGHCAQKKQEQGCSENGERKKKEQARKKKDTHASSHGLVQLSGIALSDNGTRKAKQQPRKKKTQLRERPHLSNECYGQCTSDTMTPQSAHPFFSWRPSRGTDEGVLQSAR